MYSKKTGGFPRSCIGFSDVVGNSIRCDTSIIITITKILLITLLYFKETYIKRINKKKHGLKIS